MLLRSVRSRHAAKQFARKVPQWLSRAYGSSELYTEPQIRRAVLANGLDQRFLGLALAAYLTREQYDEASAKLLIRFEYAAARELFFNALPTNVRSRDGFPAPMNSEAFWGASNGN